MTPAHQNRPNNDVRLWRSVCYLLEELPPSERDEFEAALAEDVELCVALAQATQLVAGLQAMRPLPQLRPVPHRPGRTVWLATAVSVAALALFAVLLSESLTVNRPLATVRLVSLWRRGVPAASHVLSETDDDDHIAADDHIPGWLIAAVSLEHSVSRRGESPLSDRNPDWEDN